jgi:hypothetical protein
MQDHHQLQPFSMSSPAPVTWQQQFPSLVYPNSSSNIPTSMKRGRVYSEESSVSLPSLTCDTSTQRVMQMMTSCGGSSSQVPISGTPKKARSNNYRVPHSIKPSLLTAMGTLAGGMSNRNGLQGSVVASVPMRRRLSGGHLDQYIGGHDTTFDTDSNRPRSMSFG